jgi:hypothetical protein
MVSCVMILVVQLLRRLLGHTGLGTFDNLGILQNGWITLRKELLLLLLYLLLEFHLLQL